VTTVAARPAGTGAPGTRPPGTTGPGTTGPGTRLARARAYLSLTKPRIVELLLITAVPAMMLAAGGLPPPGVAAVVLVAGAMAAGSANALNCYLDRDIDRMMRRTARRPLPAHTLEPRPVLVFGLALGMVSVALLAVFTNLLAAVLALAAIVYYDLVYTLWLKRRTPHNTVLGGVCGAAPVLIGWAAVTGSLDLTAWLLFAVVFLWQPPHFYALALRFRDDYARAGVPMLPVVAGTGRVTGESVVYCWLTVAASMALWVRGMGPLYGAVAVVLGGLLLREAHWLHARVRRGGPVRPMRLFHWSTTYLAVLSGAVAVDALISA
jgi:protoheme IX farnesyltransferase